MSSEEDKLQWRSSARVFDDDDDDDDEDDDADSGAGSDDVDISELGDIGEELCQVGNQMCSVPFELYDLPDLGQILSVDVWNNCLTEEERLGLAEFLPDMDQETFMCTLKELFSGGNFHFGSPLVKLFDMLKGGLCEPRVSLYRQYLNFFQKRKHYHQLRNYQNSIIGSLVQIKDAWKNCTGYSIEERLRVLNLMRSQGSLMREDIGGMDPETDSSGREEFSEGFWNKRLKEHVLGMNIGQQGGYKATPTTGSRGSAMTVQSGEYGRQNPKGILKLAGSRVHSTKDLQDQFPSSGHGFGTKHRPRNSTQNHYDLGRAHHAKGQLRGGGDADEQVYETTLERYRTVRSDTLPKVGSMKTGKKHLLKSEDGFATSSLGGLPLSLKNDALRSHGRNRNVNQSADIEQVSAKHDRSSFDYNSQDPGRKAKKHLLSKGGHLDCSASNHPFLQNKIKEMPSRSGKWNMGKGFPSGKGEEDPNLDIKLCRKVSHHMNDVSSHPNHGPRLSRKIKKGSTPNGRLDAMELGEMGMFTQSDETESDSSGQVDERDDISPYRSKLAYPSSVFMDSHQYSSAKLISDPKRVNKLARKDFGVMHSSKMVGDPTEQLHITALEHSLKGKQKGKVKVRDPLYLHTDAGVWEDGFGKLVDDDGKKSRKLANNGHVQVEPGERMHQPLMKVYPAERRKKRKFEQVYPRSQSNYISDYIGDDDDAHPTHRFINDGVPIDRVVKKGQTSEAQLTYYHETPEKPLLGCNSMAKKWKGKADVAQMDGPDESDHLNSSPEQQIDESCSLKKRKRKVEAGTGALAGKGTSEKGLLDVDSQTKPGKKPFTLIMPTVHTGFSFSIIHLLSAVRVAMVSPLTEEISEMSKHHEKNDGSLKTKKEEKNVAYPMVNGMPHSHSHENMELSTLEHGTHNDLPSLTLQEIVNHVRSNPGDPCILETQEPLQDLIRGVLKIFSSKTAPLGAKGWKALVSYEKSTKCWLWIGPVSSSSSDTDTIEEETSSEAWGLPHKMLVKLVDAFANWLKNGQETLQQIGSLPTPPLSLMQPNLDEKERFRDLRAQKSLTTINPSSEEVREYFRREEVLRYSVPDRAFAYTAADGRKSVVAPLKRCGGKPTSKARDHFMLKPGRPPHVTILCLVRDAAARLPGSIGTRADVCTLIRDSQYIVEDVSDAQVNQVVSGALDRLHYERDPCVQFDGERKLWVYLHREREEEDFEDDGTSSTKKWKRPRKDAVEQSDPGIVSVASHGPGEQITVGSDAGYKIGSELNVESMSPHTEERAEFVCNDLRSDEEEKTRSLVGSGRVIVHRGHPMGWDVLGLNSPQENKLLCQENSTNEDYDDEAFSRDRPVGLVSASIS